jgi:hypothetical protein
MHGFIDEYKIINNLKFLIILKSLYDRKTPDLTQQNGVNNSDHKTRERIRILLSIR